MTRKVQNRIDELIEGFETAMLVTHSLEGELRARPMAIARRDAGGMLYFTTRSDDEKLEEVLQSSNVAVTLQAEDHYVSLSGRARVETDLQLAKDLWTPAMRAWFPDGYRDKEYTVILVEPTYVEYWDRSGLRKLEVLWETGKAIVKGERAEDENLGGHAKLRFEDNEAKPQI